LGVFYTGKRAITFKKPEKGLKKTKFGIKHMGLLLPQPERESPLPNREKTEENIPSNVSFRGRIFEGGVKTVGEENKGQTTPPHLGCYDLSYRMVKDP